MKTLSVIIVNYNSVQDILNCLKSAYQFSAAHSFEWIIVNNDIKEKRKEEVVAAFPEVRWIDMGYNAGFARANNTGIRNAGANTILLLNPDTIIQEDAINQCQKRLASSPFVGASVQLKNPDGSNQITGNYVMTGGLNHLLPLPYLGSLLRKIAFALGTKKTNIIAAGTEEKVDWINGAFLMVKKQAIEKAGLLDEDFFLYFEEAEWCSRLNKQGDLCVFGDISTIHLQGESVNTALQTEGKGYSNLSGRKGLQLIVSQHLRIRKQFGVFWFSIHLLVHTFEIPIFFVLSFLENLFRLRNPFRDWLTALSFTKNVGTLWLLTPRILSGKPYFYRMF
ncbi:MAG: glycosyltransferase family 2 protein [Chitinophagaceae bacterium]|nr:glycosyltransferase family 2 protein [Chitinophagaceae bacterium]MCW5913652.1 glycosyltransferase family 2 protein [Chitinophagaceae bacterium]MCZ2397263.1 glycosyltransferase family 2 protein [Chitinophagales bacterium]